ncbi:hypothetical protein TI39_contig5835g00001 [Zymoseptoria brevis]|uniref:GAG-pre-integrase domain-containing protein n=1 Tax=Zymoseptoria brevis TaxID=1047168 RepID=A0A0F4G5M5_9PEZI|nr:hypothetical protein TI39_contig5835g00001 [Zymoseptoria brevis]
MSPSADVDDSPPQAFNWQVCDAMPDDLQTPRLINDDSTLICFLSPRLAIHSVPVHHSIIIDSEPSAHYCDQLAMWTEYRQFQDSEKVRTQYGTGTLWAQGVDSMVLKTPKQDGHTNDVPFSYVYFVPKLCVTLPSTEVLRLKGLFYRNDQRMLFRFDASGPVRLAEMHCPTGLPQSMISTGHLALATQPTPEEHVMPSSTASADDWHGRLGHADAEAFRAALHNTTRMDLPRHLIVLTRTMLLAAPWIPQDMWPEASKHTAYLLTFIPAKALRWKPLYEIPARYGQVISHWADGLDSR